METFYGNIVYTSIKVDHLTSSIDKFDGSI